MNNREIKITNTGGGGVNIQGSIINSDNSTITNESTSRTRDTDLTSVEELYFQQFNNSVKSLVPPDLHEHLRFLAIILAKTVSSITSTSAISQEVQLSPVYKPLLEVLQGQTAPVATTLLSFGEGNQMGDVVIRDIVAGSVYRITLNMSGK